MKRSMVRVLPASRQALDFERQLGKSPDGLAVADLQERFDDFKRRQIRGLQGLGDVGRVPVAQIFDVDAAGGLEWIDVRNVKLEGGVHGGSLAFCGPNREQNAGAAVDQCLKGGRERAFRGCSRLVGPQKIKWFPVIPDGW
jgi:hypothetical protein